MRYLPEMFGKSKIFGMIADSTLLLKTREAKK